MRISATFLAASFLVLFGCVAARDYCADVAKWPDLKKLNGYDESKACLKQFPFDKARATRTLDTLVDVLGAFYPFKDIASRPPRSRLSLKNVDVLKQLNALRRKRYRSDFDFQNDIQNIVFSLYDAHVNYEPDCYSWTWEQLLMLYAPVEHGKQRIKVFDVGIGYVPSVTKDLIECEVLEIDGKPAMDVIIKFAKESGGKMKDLNVRFNSALSANNNYRLRQFSEYSGSWQKQYQLPGKALTKYRLRCPGGKQRVLTLPWLVTAGGYNWTDGQAYWEQMCVPPPEVSRLLHVPSKIVEKPELPVLQRQTEPGSVRKTRQAKPTSTFVTLSNDTTFVFGYFPKGRGVPHKTGVMFVGTFSPRRVDYFYWGLLSGLDKFKKLGIEKVIIDVQNNGGGSLCLGQLLVHVLSNDRPSNTTTPDLEHSSDILVTKQSLTLATLQASYSASPFSEARYISIKGANLTTAWVTHPLKYTRGGKTSSYSQRVRTNCQSILTKGESVLNPLGRLPWKFKDYLILSNGLCGSTCAVFTNRMHQLKGVKTVAVGGIHRNSMVYNSFPGGQVLDYDGSILPILNTDEYGDLHQKYPKLFKNFLPLPTSVDFRFTFREGYYPDLATTPAEYQFIPADIRLDYDPNTARNIELLWAQATTLFGK